MSILLKCEQIYNDCLNLLGKTDSSKGRDISLFKGRWGTLLFLFYYERYCNNSNNKAISHLGSLYDELDTHTLNFTYCNGLSGPFWLLNHLNKHNFIDINMEEIIPEFISSAIEQNETLLNKSDFDFLHGSVGISNLLVDFSGNQIVKEHLVLFVNRLFNFASKTNKGLSLPIYFYYTEEKASVGIDAFSLAHGNCAILILLIKIHKAGIEIEKCLELIEGIIQFILSNENVPTQESDSLFPAYLSDGNRHSRISWCYGDINVAIALWQCGKYFDNRVWKDKAIEIMKYNAARNSCKTSGVLDICLCHGTAGNAAMYMRMWDETKEPLLLKCKNDWYNLTHEMFQIDEKENAHGVMVWQGKDEQWQYRWDLLEGSAGVGLSLISEYVGKALPWDEFLLIS